MVTVRWTESYQELEQECLPTKCYEPYQEVSHKKECICPDPTKECYPPTDLSNNSNPSNIIDKYPFNAVQNLPGSSLENLNDGFNNFDSGAYDYDYDSIGARNDGIKNI